MRKLTLLTTAAVAAGFVAGCMASRRVAAQLAEEILKLGNPCLKSAVTDEPNVETLDDVLAEGDLTMQQFAGILTDLTPDEWFFVVAYLAASDPAADGLPYSLTARQVGQLLGSLSPQEWKLVIDGLADGLAIDANTGAVVRRK